MNLTANRFYEIEDLDDPVETQLPNYSPPVNEDGSEAPTPTWREYFETTPNHRPTEAAGRLFIGAAVFAHRSLKLTAEELAQLDALNVPLVTVEEVVALQPEE